MPGSGCLLGFLQSPRQTTGGDECLLGGDWELSDTGQWRRMQGCVVDGVTVVWDE